MPRESSYTLDKNVTYVRRDVIREGPLVLDWTTEELQSWWNTLDPLLCNRINDTPASWRGPTYSLGPYIDSATRYRPWYNLMGSPLRGVPDENYLLAELNLYRLAIQCRHYRRVHGKWPPIGAGNILGTMELKTAVTPFDALDPSRGPFRAELRAGNTLTIYSAYDSFGRLAPINKRTLEYTITP